MRLALASALMLAVASPALAGNVYTVATFDDVAAGKFTPPGAIADAGVLGAPGAFVFNGNAFNNSYYPDFNYWEGWALSNQATPIDVDPDGYFLNQFLAAPLGAASGSNYAVAFSSLAPGFEALATINLAAGQRAHSIDLTNTWYTRSLIQTGNTYGGKFYADDYFELVISGYDAVGDPTGVVRVLLADYRGGQTFILDTWKNVSLLSLGDATKLEFSFFTTDSDPRNGPNTPTYIAVDNFTTYAPGAVPEPSSLALLGLGVAGAVVALRRRG